MNGTWGEKARHHWQLHLPDRYAALDDPDRYFADLDREATAYCTAIRDGLLEGLSPNDGTIGWPEFLRQVAWANQIAAEIVATELIYIPGEDDDADYDEEARS